MLKSTFDTEHIQHLGREDIVAIKMSLMTILEKLNAASASEIPFLSCLKDVVHQPRAGGAQLQSGHETGGGQSSVTREYSRGNGQQGQRAIHLAQPRR